MCLPARRAHCTALASLKLARLTNQVDLKLKASLLPLPAKWHGRCKTPHQDLHLCKAVRLHFSKLILFASHDQIDLIIASLCLRWVGSDTHEKETGHLDET